MLAAAVASGGLAGWQGYSLGVERTEARHAKEAARVQKDLDKVADQLSEASADLEASRAARDALIRRLESEARNDPDAASRRPSADSLRRLQERWRSAD